MLRLAQSVKQSETPGSATEYSILEHPWSLEGLNMLKRRKTDSDCCPDNKSENDYSTDTLGQHIIFHSAEITLTPIPKNNHQINDQRKRIKLCPTVEQEQAASNKQNMEYNNSSKILPKVPPEYRFILENNDEIQLTSLGSNEAVEMKDEETFLNPVDDSIEVEEIDMYKGAEQDEDNIDIFENELFYNQPENEGQISGPTEAGLAVAEDYLKIKVAIKIQSPEEISNITQDTFNDVIRYQHPVRSNNAVNCRKVHCTTIARLNRAITESTECQPLNNNTIFYPNLRDVPYYRMGFPNPVGENRCWINSTLQSIFSLPILDELDTLHFPQPSQLMTSLINVQKLWRKGLTNCSAFSNVFGLFKMQLSTLNDLYYSSDQQDVSEFIMSLLNNIKNEFEAVNNLHHNEIENIPNNDQDSTSKCQSVYEANKRLPLSDISATAGQLKNNCIVPSYDIVEKMPNPIEEYFLSYMIEKYTCINCKNSREISVENLMLFIDLPSHEHGNEANLINMINATFAEEKRSMTCEICKHGTHTMSNKFKKLPEVLMVQLNRYKMSEGIGTKRSTFVDVPRELTLDHLLVANHQHGGEIPLYKPQCIISHIGDSINSGHYISFVKHEDQWVYYNDNIVRMYSEDEVFRDIRQNAYVIIFQNTKLDRHKDY